MLLGIINKISVDYIAMTYISKWLAIANEVDSMKIQKRITHLKTRVHLLYEAYDKINLSIT